MQGHGISLGVNRAFNRFDDARKKRIGDSAHHNRNRIRFANDKVPCAVVWNVAVLFHGFHHLCARLFAHIRVVVKHPGNRADARAAKLCNVFYGKVRQQVSSPNRRFPARCAIGGVFCRKRYW